MTTAKFEIGKEYGNDLTIKILNKTAKFVTFETRAWGVRKAQIKTDNRGERVFFKAWIIEAFESFDAKTASQIFYEKCYN